MSPTQGDGEHAPAGSDAPGFTSTALSDLFGNAFIQSQLGAETETSPEDPCRYTVKRGDTLWDISRRFRGRGDLYPELHQNNQKVIGDDPDLIQPDQDLNVCPVPTATAADAGAAAKNAALTEEERAQVETALAAVKGQLDTGFLDWVVTDQEANAALTTLNGLPPQLQGSAIEKMDEATFGTLLSEVPTMDKAGFQTLFENTHDPKKKLKLWAEYHKGEVAKDAALEGEKTKDEGGWWPFDDTAEQKENARLNERREEITASTNKEIEDEVKVAMDQLAKGKLTEKDVLDIAERKQLEHELEMKYNINLVNDEGVRNKDGTKICWTTDELKQMANALPRVPEEHLKGNTVLKEIRRSEIKTYPNGTTKSTVGGDHLDGVIRIYDTGAKGSYRHTGDMPEGVNTAESQANPLKPLEETIVHELGHDVADINPAAYAKFVEAVNWESFGDSAAVKQAGLTDAQIRKLSSDVKATVVVGGKTYRMDKYHTNPPRFVAYDADAIPSLSTGAQPNQATANLLPSQQKDTWSYAQMHPQEHFAEAYQKAVHMPETLAKDLLDAPQKRVNDALTAETAAKTALTNAEAEVPQDAMKIKAAKDTLALQQQAVADAKSDQEAQEQQWNILRSDVFHADKSTAEAVERLKAKGVPEDKIKEFEGKAGRLQTPEQIGVLEAGY